MLDRPLPWCPVRAAEIAEHVGATLSCPCSGSIKLFDAFLIDKKTVDAEKY
jgi:uncharacterized protein (DUF983 family)